MQATNETKFMQKKSHRPILLVYLCITFSLSFFPVTSSFAEPRSPFDFPEPIVEPSPKIFLSLPLNSTDTVVDFDVSPLRAEVAGIIKSTGGASEKIILWKMDAGGKPQIASQSWDLPKELSLQSLTWHPSGQEIFLLGSRSGQFEILKTPVTALKMEVIYKSKKPLRRLVVGPRPFELESTQYRLFFGIKKGDGHYAVRTITENGKREYSVLDSKADSLVIAGMRGADSDVIIVPDALPVSFHPAGDVMIWEDNKHCFHKAIYSDDHWSRMEKINKTPPICDGSLTYTPNGSALLQWKKGKPGVEFRWMHEAKTETLAAAILFQGTPSSVADGKGIVGLVKTGQQMSLQYVPIDVPLADVINAWMYLESSKDKDLLTKNSGLFRPTTYEQLYQLYDSELYKCGAYLSTHSSRPYFVSTDIFWELYSAAFEGVFILSEREMAIPAFWSFVEKAASELKIRHADSRLFKVLSALKDVNSSNLTKNPETALILKAAGKLKSTLNEVWIDFGNLKPRSHYTTTLALQNYFKAMKYLTQIDLSQEDILLLKTLSKAVQDEAKQWIQAYEAFTAPSRRPLVWESSKTIPGYVLKPDLKPGLFPLSWGIDHEILNNSVFHQDWPKEKRIEGPGGMRLLPSGLDLASVLGSAIAETLLDEANEFKQYPPLKVQFGELRERLKKFKLASDARTSLYSQWMDALGTQWSQHIISPGHVMQDNFWQIKRLQTGLASWSTLRHATMLVNERSVAECGEAGFEDIVMRPPRGYVEPDPETFEAIAGLFETTMAWVKESGKKWKGSEPRENNSGEKSSASQSLQQGILRRLEESRDKVKFFRDVAKKELQGIALSAKEYEEILYVGRAAEHNFLIFKSLASKDFALSTPQPVMKVTDVASVENHEPFLLVGVGTPWEWNQLVPFFGRKQIAKGVAYSYQEFHSPKVRSDDEWRVMLKSLAPKDARPNWVAPFISEDKASCPPKVP